MAAVEKLARLLPAEAAEALLRVKDRATQIHIRSGRPLHVVCGAEDFFLGEAVGDAALRHILAALMDYSLYARESELAQGFFTLNDGSRVGVCGRLHAETNGQLTMTDIGSICVRIAREVKGCADVIMPYILSNGAPRSTLLISRPGVGKTTMLRDLARQLSDGGLRVAVADERHELAACARGIPTLNVGLRTDVMDGCPKWMAIGRMIRSMAPEVIIADEIGGERDAEALADARRCGVSVIATAHGDSLDDLGMRSAIAPALGSGVFERAVLLGDSPGDMAEIRALDGTESRCLWRCA